MSSKRYNELQEFIYSSINVPATNNLDVGENLGVAVTTYATSPTQWYLNSKSGGAVSTYSVTVMKLQSRNWSREVLAI
jgi:hypothetical protein